MRYDDHRWKKLTTALGHTPTPLSTGLAGSTVWSLQCVAYITGVGHYRVVGCTGETALAICGSTRIATVDGWKGDHGVCQSLVSTPQTKQVLHSLHLYSRNSADCDWPVYASGLMSYDFQLDSAPQYFSSDMNTPTQWVPAYQFHTVFLPILRHKCKCQPLYKCHHSDRG